LQRELKAAALDQSRYLQQQTLIDQDASRRKAYVVLLVVDAVSVMQTVFLGEYLLGYVVPALVTPKSDQTSKIFSKDVFGSKV
jgi:hypothetical protein